MDMAKSRDIRGKMPFSVNLAMFRQKPYNRSYLYQIIVLGG